MKKIYKTINTIKYMSMRQIAFRSKYEVTKNFRKKIYKIKVEKYLPSLKYISLSEEECTFYRNNYEINLEQINNLMFNKFCFLNNLNYKFEGEIVWDLDPYNYRLWVFNLNYFDYLNLLIDGHVYFNNTKYLIKGIELINSWIEKNSQKYDKNLWDPFVVAKRLCNWSTFISYTLNYMNINEIDTINGCIATQTRYLSKNIEYYLDANHVVMDAKALVFSGMYLNNNKYFEKGMSIFLKEYKRQVLKDGGHYERSTSYHVEVLQHYLESYILLLKNNRKLFIDDLKNICLSMYNYLNDITMPNKEIPLLNDSSLDYPIYSNDILQCGTILFNEGKFKSNCINKLSMYAFRLFGLYGYTQFTELKEKSIEFKNAIIGESGYCIIRDKLNSNEQMYLLFDCGDNGPDYNLGHAHADNLSIILTIDNKKIFVDSGTYTYKKCKQRDDYRITKAHNTIEIDGIPSSEVWSAFRVAKRAKTRIINYEQDDKYTIISAEHDGYTKVLKKDSLYHRRVVVYLKHKGIVIIDSIHGKVSGIHNANINFIIGIDNIKSISNNEFKLLIDTMMITIKTDYIASVNESMRSEIFSEQISCNILSGQVGFEKEISLVTLISFDSANLKVKKINNKFNIFDNSILIKEIEV